MRDQLRALFDLSAKSVRQQFGTRLPSGHDTWQADGQTLLVLSALPRRIPRRRKPRHPWQRAALAETPTGSTFDTGMILDAPKQKQSVTTPFELCEPQPRSLALNQRNGASR